MIGTSRQQGRGTRSVIGAILGLVLAAGAPGPSGGLRASGAAPESTTPTKTALSVASVPAGANVYLDGRLAGNTPLDLAGLASGDHRLTLVKDGYLANSRQVSVGHGGTRSVNVRLTPEAQASPPPPDPAKSLGGGGLGKKTLLIGLGAVAAGALIVAVAAGESNVAPVAVLTTDLEGQALLGATQVAFSASGSSDANGDPLSYSWNFGDGTTGTGAEATHVYDEPGTFEVTLTVGDGKLTATDTDSVSVRGLNGTWLGKFVGDFGAGLWTFFHNGSTVTGIRGSSGSTAPFSGRAEHPRRVIVSSPGNKEKELCPFEVSVDANSSITVMTGTLTVRGGGCGLASHGATFTRR